MGHLWRMLKGRRSLMFLPRKRAPQVPGWNSNKICDLPLTLSLCTFLTLSSKETIRKCFGKGCFIGSEGFSNVYWTKTVNSVWRTYEENYVQRTQFEIKYWTGIDCALSRQLWEVSRIFSSLTCLIDNASTFTFKLTWIISDRIDAGCVKNYLWILQTRWIRF